MTQRSCYKCGESEGPGKRELRPYGPGGKDVCAGCMFGENGKEPDPAVREEAERQLGARLLAGGPLVLVPEEQLGPRPIRSKGNA
jgi:hypothetical protein